MIDFTGRLVDLEYIDASAIEIVQAKRDPPAHGIGLRPIGKLNT